MKDTPAPTSAPFSAVDAQNPWLGLVSYTEENRAYFHGRDEEARELVRRLERKTLTILFGQSGLGKSSLLQAGVFPRLRAAGFVPIYLRLDHGPEAPALAEQIKPAVFFESSLMGTWSHPGSAAPGESLWEFFHHRDDVLTGGSGQQLIPVLVFDQFEELFTLGAADDTTRARALAFIAELADLVENRAPTSFEARVDAGAVQAEAFDFARSDYRVLITLREDYLPHLESLKSSMPSLMQNRMRLTRLTAAQALEAVVKPSPGLVPEDVANAIVAFVSGRNDLAQAEVEPSLLSLVCRELNHRRRVAHAAQIDADLLAGSRETILTEFYERTMADQTPAVRHWVEDALLTDSGYRENVALERARKSLTAAGADAAAIDVLVSRRLLRIEERLDVRRIELTHDVLCAVVRASRDARREREAREATERRRQEAEAELARVRIAELDTRRSLVRARLIAGGAALLALAAVAAATWGIVNSRRAHRAETAALQAQAEAQRTRGLADSARLEAEGLLNYLLDEFSWKLTDIGQFPLFEQLTRRTVDYYQHLPAELAVDATERNRAWALTMLGSVLNQQNRTDEALTPTNEALTILRRRISAGDHTFEAAKGLTYALAVRATIYDNQSLAAESLRTVEESVSNMRPWMADPARTKNDKFQYAQLLMSYGWTLQSTKGAIAGEQSFTEAAKYLLEAGADDPKNERVAHCYSINLKGLCFAAQVRGDHEQALRFIQEALRLQNAILEQSPDRTPTISERAGALNAMAAVLDSLGKLKEAVEAARQADLDYSTYLKSNPTDGRSRQWSLGNRAYIGFFKARLGNLRESREILQESLVEARKWKISSAFAGQLGANAYDLATSAAEAGDREGADAAQKEMKHYIQEWMKDTPAEHFAKAAMPEWSNISKIEVDTALGKSPAGILENAQATLARLQKLKPEDSVSESWDRMMQASTYALIATTALDLERYEEAEGAAASATQLVLATDVLYNPSGRIRTLERLARDRAWALAGLGRLDEARKLIQPMIEKSRTETAAVPDDLNRRLNFACELLINARAQEPEALSTRRQLLTEAQALIRSLPAEMTATSFVRKTQQKIAEEFAKLPNEK